MFLEFLELIGFRVGLNIFGGFPCKDDLILGSETDISWFSLPLT